MATLNNDFTFNGSLGNLSAYKIKGLAKTVIRTKGGGSKQKIKTAASCLPIRQQNAEWGGCSAAGARVRLAFNPIKHLTSAYIGGTLIALAKEIQKQDTVNGVGTRSILFSKYRSLLEGFNLNKDNVFNGVVKNPLSAVLQRGENATTATVVIPGLIPGLSLYNPQRYPVNRFIAVLGIVPDMVYGRPRYEAVKRKARKGTNSAKTGWISANAIFEGQTLSIVLEQAGLDDSCSLMLTVGIEFGVLLSDNLVNPVKHTGSAQIITMG